MTKRLQEIRNKLLQGKLIQTESVKKELAATKVLLAEAILNAMNGNDYSKQFNNELANEEFLQAKLKFEKLNDLEGIAFCEYLLGSILIRMNMLSEALSYLLSSQAYFKSVNNEKRSAQVKLNLGVLHDFQGDFDNALSYYRSATEQFEKLNMPKEKSKAMLNISSILSDQGNHQASLEILEKVQLIDAFPDYDGKATMLMNMSLRLAALGRNEEAWAVFHSIEKQNIANQFLKDGLLSIKADLLRMMSQDEQAKSIYKNLLISMDYQGAESIKLKILESMIRYAKEGSEFENYIKYTEMWKDLKEATNSAATQREISNKLNQQKLQQILQEHEKEKAVLYSTLPKHVADRVIAGEKVTDDYKSAGVFFMDIVDFTKNSSGIQANEVVSMLEDIFSLCDDVFEKHNITKIKTIGDSYLTVSGIPIPQDQHQQHLAEASLEILEKISQLKFPHLDKVEVRIGLHYGPLTAGVVGKERFQYDVWGDTVNMAARLESTGVPGKIHVSEEFKNALASSKKPTTGSFKFEKREVHIKGKGKMKTYFLSY